MRLLHSSETCILYITEKVKWQLILIPTISITLLKDYKSLKCTWTHFGKLGSSRWCCRKPYLVPMLSGNNSILNEKKEECIIFIKNIRSTVSDACFIKEMCEVQRWKVESCPVWVCVRTLGAIVCQLGFNNLFNIIWWEESVWDVWGDCEETVLHMAHTHLVGFIMNIT